MAKQNDTIRTEIDPGFFQRRHPDYDARHAHWNFLEKTYYGGRDWFDDNIHKYFREGPEEFKDRVKRAYRFNHTREVVDLVTKYVFKAEINRSKDAPAPVQEFWKRATRGGTNIDDLMRQVSQMTSIFGQPYIVVDSNLRPPDAGGPITQRDLRETDARVYAYCVKPQDALDMSFDEYGHLNWILFRETDRDDADFFTNHKSITRYRLWTRNEWYLYEIVSEKYEDIKKIRVVSEQPVPKVKGSAAPAQQDTSRLVVKRVGYGRHDLGEVPVIIPRERHSDSNHSAPGLIDDIAYLDRAIANYLSNLDAIIQDQTFSTLTIPAQALNSADQGGTIRDLALEMGTKRVAVYDVEAGKGPEYISPDPSQVEVITGVITKIITEIYHSVGMAGERTKMDNAVGIDNSSGVAKAYDFDRMNTMLKAKADTLSFVENELVRLVLAWQSNETETNYVVYPDEFDTRNLYDEFDVASRLALLDAPEAARRHQMSILIEKMFPNLSQELRDEIARQVKEWPPEDVTAVRAPSRLQDRSVPPEENRQGQAVADDDQ